MMTLVLGLSLPAAACGGFFCSPAIAPIDQAAEEIVFAHDSEAGVVEMHIEITYEGQSADFAWVLPVPEEPELFLSSADLFAELAMSTAPTFTTRSVTEGRCREPVRLGCAQEVALSTAVDDSAYGGVDIIETNQIGPYDTVTLQADSAEGLLDWLVENNFDLPSDIEPLLDLYVADQSYFVAMRLSASYDTGDIEPIALRYAADDLAIPIQLTSIAAAPDMPLRVYIFGDHRAVPDSYLHAEINEAAIDWLGQGSNYYEVVEAAANVADGHAFVTEYAGSTDLVTGNDSTLRGLAGDYPYLTRLTAVLSPEEMTVDPTFVFNPDLPEVAKDRVADLVVDCSGNKKRENAPMYVELADGRRIYHDPNTQFGDTSGTVDDLQTVPAIALYATSSTENELIADFFADAEDALANHNDKYDTGGCGCNTGRVPGSLMGLALLALVVRRRRPIG